jgi:uncharacterized repeat protein (TIGR01451 family)
MKLRRALSFLVAALVLAFCFAQSAKAQIAQDNISTINSSGSVSSLSWFHGVGSGANRILLVGVSYRDGNITTTSVTYGVTPLTRIGVRTASSNQNRTELWYLLGPPSGSNAVAVAVSPAKQMAAAAISFNGVNQTTPVNTFASAAGLSSTPSVSAASASGELVVDTLTANGDAVYMNVNSGQTQRWTLQTGTTSLNVRSGGSTEPGANSSVNMSWTMGQSTYWSIAAVSLKPITPPNVALNKAVSPSGTQLPGTNLAYSIDFANGGGMAALNLVLKDPIPANTDFKISSETHNLATTGLAVAVTYSNDGGASWTYTPVSGGGGASAGYDRNVTNIRWAFSGNLMQTSPNNSGSVGFTSRIR